MVNAGQDKQKPRRAVNSVQPECIKHFEPERSELDDVILECLVLLEYRTDNLGNTDCNQQRDRQVH